MAITIAQDRLKQIKTVLGFPTEDESFLLTDQQIKDYCVEPALRLYFGKFPKVEQTETDVTFNEELTVDFYNSCTYGVVDARLTNQEFTNTSTGYNGFLYLAAYNQNVVGKNFGKTGYNPNSLSQARWTQNQALKSRANMDKTIRIRVDYENRNVTIHSNRQGKLLITWALTSENFADVRYNYIEDTLDLCRGYLLKHAARTMGIFQNTNIPVNINYDFLNSEGDALITRVTEKWNEISGILLIKN